MMLMPKIKEVDMGFENAKSYNHPINEANIITIRKGVERWGRDNQRHYPTIIFEVNADDNPIWVFPLNQHQERDEVFDNILDHFGNTEF